MKDFLHKLELPEFIKDSRLTASMIIILSLSLLGSVIAMIMNPLFGLAMVFIFILTVAFAIYGTYILAGNANNFAVNVSYRIKRSEQEAMIKTLNKQLTHCETDLQAHMDMVATLEASLGDSEKNREFCRVCGCIVCPAKCGFERLD